ncbi:DUF4174 domain-containing protein [Cognatishimia sp. WU-CL00825]|uniref:DUF4174 domain-containing protein n=1 Tax=Cognatishimia sp. WU-CL00825 TaxID=3127658 RepID=UPI003105CD99
MGTFNRLCLALVIPLFLGSELAAQEAVEPDRPSVFIDDTDVDIDGFLWTHRPIVVFADSENDPRFVKQLELLNALPEELRLRDVVVLTDTDPAAKSALRKKLRPRGFMFVLIGKDGTVYLRKPLPWNVREITRSIDKLPMRQQEIRDRRVTQ